MALRSIILTALLATVAWPSLGIAGLRALDESTKSKISFANQIAPILADHCFECHGPDEAQREAGLRLDVRENALTELESGYAAIIPGDSNQSELIRRVSIHGDERMPPESTGDGLSAAEIALLERWVDEGASFEAHWSFVSPRRPRLPTVEHRDWANSPIDYFILARLESEELSPLEEADRRTLIRRIYFDLIGLPPTPAQIHRFLADTRPDALERLVDDLLASPLYGQRWGRHWLDVARYGDSNGGDENHAYPLAWRYRDYVIAASNEDIGFDTFVREQIAGDLIEFIDNDETSERGFERLSATGYLALGTKILAEQDPVKMRADLVDEQIDTLGKTFLASTIGCARCHDHKFDPIPTSDYYALAGIFNSSQLVDQTYESAEWKAEMVMHEASMAEIKLARDKLNESLRTIAGEVVELEAEEFDRGNVNALDEGYGEGIGVISDPGAQMNFAEYDLLMKGGTYLLQLRYAAQSKRPGSILVNGELVKRDAINQVTGGWMPEHQQWFTEGLLEFAEGENIIRLESEPLMSHIDRIRLIRCDDPDQVKDALARIDEFEKQLTELNALAPKPVHVMSIVDQDPHDLQIHVRGSHLSLGEEVSRGFPSIFQSPKAVVESNQQPQSAFPINETQSGRWQLAQWLTDSENGAGGYVARVYANRIWHWHFGRGIAATPNDFGIQGARPTHSDLLDWLAIELIENSWSPKSIHRQIVLSATYRQKTASRSNSHYRGVPLKRLEAETIRDALLFTSGKLDTALGGEPLMVKSQDPSPEDLRNNENAYRNYRRRSAYLPVVRSNVYRFLTLFDFPNAAAPVGVRDRTVVPTQALLLMNDPFVMEQAKLLAKRILASKPQEDEESRIATLVETVFGRLPSTEETESMIEFLREYRLLVDDDENRELAAWTSMCQSLFASNEFIYVE